MDYIIGAGAILESGDSGSITPATLHAQVDADLAGRARVAAIDFESTRMDGLRRLLVLVQGWNVDRFRLAVAEKLRAQGTCTLAEVLLLTAREAGVPELHFFAHWVPDEATCAALAEAGVALVCHRLESIHAASLVAGRRVRRFAA